MPRIFALLVLFIVSSVTGFGGEALETTPGVNWEAVDGARPEMNIPGLPIEGRHTIYYLHETFDGPVFPPDGWGRYTSHPNGDYDWEQNNSSYAGGTAPEAILWDAYWASGQDYDTILYTHEIDTSDATRLSLQFKHHCLLGEYPAGHLVYVYVSTDNWQTRVDVTPWSNPAWWYYQIGPRTETINLNQFIGPSTSVAFWMFVPYSANNIQYWAVDDVIIYEKHLHSFGTPAASTESTDID